MQISDFGLAKWLPDQWTHLDVSNVEGTFGYDNGILLLLEGDPKLHSTFILNMIESFNGSYLPPEFFLHGTVDEKTDVYAYGVLLLELISGRPAIDENNKSVVMWVSWSIQLHSSAVATLTNAWKKITLQAKPLLVNNGIEELADPSLECDYYWES